MAKEKTLIQLAQNNEGQLCLRDGTVVNGEKRIGGLRVEYFVFYMQRYPTEEGYPNRRIPDGVNAIECSKMIPAGEHIVNDGYGNESVKKRYAKAAQFYNIPKKYEGIDAKIDEKIAGIRGEYEASGSELDRKEYMRNLSDSDCKLVFGHKKEVFLGTVKGRHK